MSIRESKLFSFNRKSTTKYDDNDNNKINDQISSNKNEQNHNYMQKVISSNQQLLKCQSQIIKKLTIQLDVKQQKIIELNKKYQQLKEICQWKSTDHDLLKKIQDFTNTINQLQNQLVKTKMELAIKSGQALEKQTDILNLLTKIKQFESEKHDLQYQRKSTLQSQVDKGQLMQSPVLTITKSTLPDFLLQLQQPTCTSILTLRSQNAPYQLIDPLQKLWSKQVFQQITKNKPYSSILSFDRSISKIQKFINSTLPLLKKYFGIPHFYRAKVWEFLCEDKLGLNNSLYIQLLQRRNQGWVNQIIQKQIEKDIHRSFNGQGSKDKLSQIHSHNVKRKSLTNPPPLQTNCQIDFLKRQSSDIQQKCQQKQANENFRISQDVTQVLQIFHIYRPDIGYVQGMTYPTIILTLVAGKINSFKILCNLLLVNDFFRRMITFEPNFINYFCRIFDELLAISHPKLYQLVIKQYEIRSEVFLVDWFFTFFCRGISPKTILRIWDLLLYQNSYSKFPQIILYRVSLSIFQLLQQILLQTTYEQCIRSIRQYFKKIDEQQLIHHVYNSMKETSLQKSFQQKFERIKSRIERKNLGIN